LLGDLRQAVSDFSAGISIDSSIADNWKRRGQSRAALNEDSEAIADLTKAISLQADSDTYHQRGLVYHKTRNYRRAIPDFLMAAKLQPSNKLAWNFAGLCQTAIGSCSEAFDSFKKVLSMDPTFREGWVNMAQCYREIGDWPRAEENFTRALKLDPQYVSGLHLRALARHGVGIWINARSFY